MYIVKAVWFDGKPMVKDVAFTNNAKVAERMAARMNQAAYRAGDYNTGYVFRMW